MLLERMQDGGRKILISGGGRCNILPSSDRPERFVTSSSRHSLRNMLRSWPLADQKAFFERELHTSLVLEPETGKLFPASNKARDVRDGLLRLARQEGVRFTPHSRVIRLDPPMGDENAWMIRLDRGQPIRASCVILATGGLSVPKTGSDGLGIAEVRRLGLTVHETYPALTPLTATPPRHAHLAGVSLDVTIRAPGHRPAFTTTGGFLFTHHGYSGPAVLDASHIVVRSSDSDRKLTVCWTRKSSTEWDEALRDTRGRIGTLLSRHVPSRLADQLLVEAGLSLTIRQDQLKREERRGLVKLLTEYALPCTGHEGYKKAEVTGGGVSLAEVNPRTMESHRHKGLYLCGEMLDAFGPIGGFNFQWAWSTGRAAGLGASGAADPPG
jgi:hypothetical protein